MAIRTDAEQLDVRLLLDLERCDGRPSPIDPIFLVIHEFNFSDFTI